MSPVFQSALFPNPLRGRKNGKTPFNAIPQRLRDRCLQSYITLFQENMNINI